MTASRETLTTTDKPGKAMRKNPAHFDPISLPRLRESESRFRYSQAVRLGSLVFVSGQIGRDAAGNVPDSLSDQATLAFQNVRDVLAIAGLGFEHVVELITYHTTFEAVDEFVAVKDRFLVQPPYPTWTALGVSSLIVPAAKIEIKVTALARD